MRPVDPGGTGPVVQPVGGAPVTLFVTGRGAVVDVEDDPVGTEPGEQGRDEPSGPSRRTPVRTARLPTPRLACPLRL